LQHPENKKFAHPSDLGVKTMMEKPALYRCALVGLGCTSIARHVLEEWPEDLPTFANECDLSGTYIEETAGEVSHDIYFCREALKQDRQVWIDTSIVCRHITEGWTDYQHWKVGSMQENPKLWQKPWEHKDTPVVYPNRAARRRGNVAAAS
jgi:hypothetical protein